MDGLQVSVVCLLLKMTFDPITAQLPQKARPCPRCAYGYFLMKNCSVNTVKSEGIQCKRCTDCSANHRETLAECSKFADSLCGNIITPAVTSTVTAPVSAPEVWIVLTVIALSLFLVLLLSLFLILLVCRNRQRNKLKGQDPL